ncbi:alpha/beta fold hydrolase [Streptomyces sp. NPDC001339]|uniref:alpha/beta fold hydrolase n=1 Tax=Streptomyces sp. NPDC001339 TaxID=3364563 RepID=UPI003697BCAD
MPSPTATITAPAKDVSTAVIAAHAWQGYHCESRLVRSTAPRIAPVVLVGGAFQTKETWGRIETGFLAHADVLAVDLPGSGRADVLPDRHGVDFLADALCHILEETGIHEANVVGGSYGTAVVYTLAQRHPDHVRKMVLAGTMTFIPDHVRAATGRAIELLHAGRMEDFADQVLDLLLNPHPAGPVTAGERIRQTMRRRLLALPPQEAEQAVANTTRLLTRQTLDMTVAPSMPVLVITGEHDHFTTPALCRELAATCADSWFTTVSDADHMMPFERSAEVVDLCTRFFAGEPLTGLDYARDAERVSPPVMSA